MRRKQNEITDPAAVEDVLRSAKFLRLAMADGEQPYIVTVCYGFEPGRIYFHCATEGRKLDMIRANPRVAFMVDTDAQIILNKEGCGGTVKYRSVIGSGKAFVVEDPDDRIHGLDVFMSQYADEGGRPGGYNEKALARTAVVRIDIDEITGKQSGRD